MQTWTLPTTSADLKRVLLRGSIEHEQRTWVALPQRIVNGSDGERLEFALHDPAQIEKPSAPKVWFEAIRAISLTATLMPCLSVLALGALNGWPINTAIAISAVAGVLLLQISVNLLNDVEDHLRLIDLPGTMGGAGIIQRGWLRAVDVRNASYAALVLGVLAGLPAVWQTPREMAVIAALALIGTFGYSGKPFGFKYIALGDAVVFLLCGPGITAGMSLAAFGQAPLGVIVLGAYFGCAAVAILHANNFQDANLDIARSAKTVAQQLGVRGSKAYLVLQYALAITALLLTSYAGLLPIAVAGVISVIALVVALPFVRKVWTAVDLEHESYRMLRVEAAQLHLALGALFLVAMGVWGAFR